MNIYKTTQPKWIHYLIMVVLVLSIVNVFNLPAPLRPRTTVGLLTALTIIGAAVTGWFLRKKTRFLLEFLVIPANYFLVGYLLINLISLLVTPKIFGTMDIRLILSAVFFSFITQLFRPTSNQKEQLIHVLGFVTIFISFLSALQLLYPNFFNLVAANFFNGRSVYGSLNYGLLNDYMRGRLLHWGIIVLSFPFFYASSYLLLKKITVGNKYPILGYIIGSFVLLVFSMVASNFRWTVLCFLLVTLVFVRFTMFRFSFPRRYILVGIAFVIVSSAVGLMTTRAIFGYNLFDRITLQDNHRDVEETLGRLFLFNQAIDVFRSSPLIGVGTENYLYYVDPYTYLSYLNTHDQAERIIAPSASHNEFFTILAESGALGLLFFLTFFYLTLRHALRMLLQKLSGLTEIDYMLLLSITSSYVAFFLYSWFENPYPHNYVYLFSLGGMVFSWFQTVNPNTKR